MNALIIFKVLVNSLLLGRILCQDCSPAGDIVFLLDASNNLQQQNFNVQLQYVSSLTKSLALGPDDFQFGVIIYASTARRVIDLDTYTEHAALEQAILSISNMQGSLRTDLALQLARLESFTTAHGARANIPKIAIVTMAGPSNDPTATAREVQQLKNSGVHVISVGIGASINAQELELLASSPTDVFSSFNFDILDSIQNIATITCNQH